MRKGSFYVNLQFKTTGGWNKINQFRKNNSAFKVKKNQIGVVWAIS